ncbi:MAG: hypothetical protein JNK64_30885 [Myxococcales bacterium]|nr:hypothetical protein [Myxococcales bacterium]
MRRDRLEVGLEREYGLSAWTGDTVAYLLAGERLLARFAAHVDADAARRDRWRLLTAAGWRLAPEYSRCLVELASPPVPRDGWAELLDGFACVEAWLADAAAALTAGSPFDRVEYTAAYSLRTDRFVTWDGAPVTALPGLLLDPTDANWLCGPPDDAPPCFAGAAPALGYAGFTSTHCTLHPPIAGRDLDARAAALATYYWRLLGAAHALDAGAPQRHPLLRGGRIPVAPDPDRSIRDALIRWGDPATAALLAGLAADAGPPLARFVALFGQPPGEAFAAPGFHAYSCRPRVVDATMLFELRCFHSGLPLADLAPLLDVAATLPDG